MVHALIVHPLIRHYISKVPRVQDILRIQPSFVFHCRFRLSPVLSDKITSPVLVRCTRAVLPSVVG